MQARFVLSRRRVLGALLTLGAVFRFRPNKAISDTSSDETVLVGRWVLKASDLS